MRGKPYTQYTVEFAEKTHFKYPKGPRTLEEQLKGNGGRILPGELLESRRVHRGLVRRHTESLVDSPCLGTGVGMLKVCQIPRDSC